MLTEETVSEYAWPKRPDKCSINRKSREVSLEEVPDRVLEELEKLGLIRSLAEQLADDPARLNHRGKQGRTLLHLLEKPREIKALIAAGADLNAIDNDGNTPLHSAFLQHAAFPVEVTRLLVENGAKLDVQNNLGQTPLFCAVRLQSGHPNIVKILLEAGADPSIKDNEGLSIYKYLGYGRPKGEEDMKRYLEVARKKRMKPWSWS